MEVKGTEVQDIPRVGANCLIRSHTYNSAIVEITIVSITIKHVKILFVENKNVLWIEKECFTNKTLKGYVEIVEVLSGKDLHLEYIMKTLVKAIKDNS